MWHHLVSGGMAGECLEGVGRGGGWGCRRRYPRLEVGGVAEFGHVPHGARTGDCLLRGTGRISEGNVGMGQPVSLTLVTMTLNSGMGQT